MEYSLYYLNKQANLKNLKVNEIIDKLNLIGFEVDDIFYFVFTIEPVFRNVHFCGPLFDAYPRPCSVQQLFGLRP